jgi:hypothetical protein
MDIDAEQPHSDQRHPDEADRHADEEDRKRPLRPPPPGECQCRGQREKEVERHLDG